MNNININLNIKVTRRFALSMLAIQVSKSVIPRILVGIFENHVKTLRTQNLQFNLILVLKFAILFHSDLEICNTLKPSWHPLISTASKKRH